MRLPAPHATIAAALLYTALAAFANPAGAQVLGESQRAGISALREGDMRKLVIHAVPVPGPDAAFIDPSGREVTLADSDGRVRLVNFWATWCAPCREEKPALAALERDLGGPGFAVLAVATGRNSPEAIAEFKAEVGVEDLQTYRDPRASLASAMAVPGLPVTAVLNRDGDEIARLTGGADWNSPSARAIIAALVAAE
jgi:thiol-disulfide isomerase/thioredoxin